MLQSLKIVNYALINQIEIDFRDGFTIITGETGAGKSILLGALSLILGNRADTSILKDNTGKCIIEGVFDIKKYKLHHFFDDNELDYENTTILRREISQSGKSRAFINDTPVNLNLLKSIGNQLIDIHSQHENLYLSDSDFQLDIIDSYAKNKNEYENYLNKYYEYQKIKKQFKKAESEATALKNEAEYIRFQFEQLDSAKLINGEYEELENELKTLNHTEEIKLNLNKSAFLLTENEEFNILANLKEAVNSIEKIKNYFEQGDEISTRLNSSYIELEDLTNEIEQINNKLEFSPDRLEFINERISSLNDLIKKHQVANIQELIKKRDELDIKLNAFYNLDDSLNELKEYLDNCEKELQKLAQQLSKTRTSVIPKIETEISKLLHQLGMPNAVFKIEQFEKQQFENKGIDEIQFLFSANKNIAIQELTKVASGGELSRLMLSLKSVLSQSKSLPTIIFDEIDTGVSGEIADKMANIFIKMAKKMQVINITHLPQIAAKGDHHFKVYKIENNKTTQSNIRLLTKDERLNEIAKMLSGENLSDAAMQNAKELLNI